MLWLLAAGASCSLFALVALGTFLPLQDAAATQYLFVWRGASSAAVSTFLVFAVLAATYGVVRWLARRAPAADPAYAAAGRWLAPLAATGVLSLGILPAVPGVGERAAPVAYFLYDLRWWWIVALAAWSLWSADRALGHPVRQWLARVGSWSVPARLLFADSTLFALVCLWAIATSPHVRFSGNVYGDEPRYIRYCETWYQGHGVDVGHNALMTDTPLTTAPELVNNGRLLVHAVRDEAQALGTDLVAFARSPLSFRWNRVTVSRFGFVTGKSGVGQYQIHQPGQSVLLFPGYLIDRYLLGLEAGHQGEFPADLPMTSLTVLLTYGLAAVVLFRLLCHALGSPRAAWPAAAVAMMSLPMSAFAFQFYPEVTATLLILTSALYVTTRASRPDTSAAVAGLAGLAAGGLTWLHPRFLLLSLALGAAGVGRSAGRSRPWFAVMFASAVLALGLYDYHITGSWMPNALYAADPDMRQIVWANVADNLLAYGFHSTWGLLAHAPWLWGVPPGLALMARRQPRTAVALAVLGLALAIPAAGHALNPAGGTPGRFVAAIVPIFIWPVAVLAQRHWHSNAIRVLAAILVVLSLDASWSYNWHYTKDMGSMADQAISGWKPNLAYPSIRNFFERPWPAGYGVFLAMVVALVVSVFFAWRPRPGRRMLSGGAAVALVVVFMLSASTVATASLHRWTQWNFQISDVVARQRAASALVAHERCVLCFSSLRNHITWRWLRPNPADEPQVSVSADGRAMRVDVQFGNANGIDGFGQMHIEFGDGTASGMTPVVGRATVTHVPPSPGTYHVATQVEFARGVRLYRQDVTFQIPK